LFRETKLIINHLSIMVFRREKYQGEKIE
jgi:hypothetical protein